MFQQTIVIFSLKHTIIILIYSCLPNVIHATSLQLIDFHEMYTKDQGYKKNNQGFHHWNGKFLSTKPNNKTRS